MARIEHDIEKPLRAFETSNREMQSMTTMQGNLQTLAKHFDFSQKKADKLNQKGGKADSGKVASASSELERASSQWSAQAPYVFEALQALDESRCNYLRDALTQLETFEVDRVEKDRNIAENTLNSILNIDTAEEIRTFVSRTTRTAAGNASRPTTSNERRQSRAASTRPPVPTLPEDRSFQQTPSGKHFRTQRLAFD